MIYQNPLTVLVEIEPDRLQSLRSLLQLIANDVESNKCIPFLQLKSIHFARFVIIEASQVNGKPTPAWLSFSSNFDGDLDDHLTELISKAGNGFDEVYAHCKNYPGKNEWVGFIKSHMLPPPNAFYIGHRGLTVEVIRYQNEVRQEIQSFLNTHPQENFEPEVIKKNIIGHLESKGFKRSPPGIHLGSLTPILVTVAIVTLVLIFLLRMNFLWLLAIVVTILIIVYIILRFKENSDEQIEVDYNQDLDKKIVTLQKAEDFNVQNQLTHLVNIKPGAFRLFILRAVLWAINLLAKTLFNKGKLGNIPTIHFARWVAIDNNSRLLFFSNFDGSWESYLGDFIDKAAVGLTGVWSNTELFPKTKNLVFDGATDEERFKYWTRVHQIPTQVWYSAYKSLSVVNILNNNEIHQGLFKPMSKQETIIWLKKL
ncbi:hypothetical protein WSM22_25450 [Cytophagales bacterium WSM2-2]|nr:hypothetical protein WSM22_25450 [Cytophagales bacterium WSM2-2]